MAQTRHSKAARAQRSCPTVVVLFDHRLDNFSNNNMFRERASLAEGPPLRTSTGTGMPNDRRVFEIVVELTDQGWMVLNGPSPFGPFFSREQALDLAMGMAAAMRATGDVVVVRVKD